MIYYPGSTLQHVGTLRGDILDVRQNTEHWLPMSGEDSNNMENRKIITMQITRNRSPNTSTHFHSTILGNGVAKENITQSNTRWNNNFTYMEKR